MSVEARGLPAHTRTLSVTLRHADAAGVDFAAYVLDLRKRGFVPVGGDIQGPGIIHHMSLSGRIDRAAGRIETIRAEMPTIAFEATPATGGESCRDRIDRVVGLAGTPLAGAYASRVGAAVGCCRPGAAWTAATTDGIHRHTATTRERRLITNLNFSIRH